MSLLSHPPLSRRGALKCMAWAGTGVLWTVSGGIPRSFGLDGSGTNFDGMGNLICPSAPNAAMQIIGGADDLPVRVLWRRVRPLVDRQAGGMELDWLSPRMQAILSEGA